METSPITFDKVTKVFTTHTNKIFSTPRHLRVVLILLIEHFPNFIKHHELLDELCDKNNHNYSEIYTRSRISALRKILKEFNIQIFLDRKQGLVLRIVS